MRCRILLKTKQRIGEQNKMITNICLLHAKKMHTSRVLAAPMAWLVFTLLLSSVATAATETVKVTTTPVFTQIPRLQACKDFQVLVRVEAPPATQQQQQQQRRIPVELTVLLDVGGGSTGTGMRRLDAVRKAVTFIISQIRDDDRLVIVAPPSISQVLGDEASKFLHIRVTRRNAETLLHDDHRDEFTAGSSVFLAKAIKILGELHAEARRSRRARFVILVTDRATAEDSSRFSKLLPLLREDDDLPTPVHTFGLGMAYDARALHDIAMESMGTYSFVDDEEEENADGITGAIAVCFSGLKGVVAARTRIRVDAHVGSSVTIERIDSGGYYVSPIAGDKVSGEVAVGVLYAGEVKSFLVHLSVPALPPSTTDDSGACCNNKQQQLLTVTATFVGSGDGDEGAAGAPASPPSPTVTSTPAILYVERPPPEAIVGGTTLPQRVPVPVVMNHMAQFGVVEMVTTFVNDVIRKRTPITVDVVTKLRVQWEEFLQARQFWSGLDLAVLDVEVSSMLSILEGEAAGSGGGSWTTTSVSAATAYVLSWLSSYQMQRPTAMGSPDRVAATFITVNMQLMVHQAVTIVSRAPPCQDSCVQPEPPPVLVPSGRDDGTYHVNAAYLQVPGVLDAINEAMKQMYLALVQTNKLRRCDDLADAEVLRAPSLARTLSFE